MLEIKEKKSKKQIIIEQAATLFKEKGYAATTMRDIAAKVGVEAASLYNHIKSKEQILANICFSLAETYTAKMAEIENRVGTPIEKIKELLYLHVEINALNSSLASVMNDEWRHLSNPEKNEFLGLRKNYEDKFAQLIKEGIELRMIKPIDSKIALFTMFSSIRWLQHWYHANRDMDVNDLKNTIIELLMNGIETT